MGKLPVFFRSMVFLVLLISIGSILLDFSGLGFACTACFQELNAGHRVEDVNGIHDHGEDHLVSTGMNLPEVTRFVTLPPIQPRPDGESHSTRPQLPPPDTLFQSG